VRRGHRATSAEMARDDISLQGCAGGREARHKLLVSSRPRKKKKDFKKLQRLDALTATKQAEAFCIQSKRRYSTESRENEIYGKIRLAEVFKVLGILC
jgi:hypothetical protein